MADSFPLRHELHWPDHPLFAGPTGDQAGFDFLIVSGPSRMGNHLLLSLLDGHSSVPSIPGEDGFLSFAFQQAAQDPKAFIDRVGGADGGDYLRRFSAAGQFDKWQAYDDASRLGQVVDAPSGVQTTVLPAFVDYRMQPPPIDYQAYARAVDDLAKKSLSMAGGFADLLVGYLKALQQLTVKNTDGKAGWSGMICHSGMRAQALWCLERFPKAHLVACLRPFATYAPSHVRSRFGAEAATSWSSGQIISEAWPHWFNKLDDYRTLKQLFPDRVHLVSYHDLVERTETTMTALATSLQIDAEPSLFEATVLGRPSGGNASDDRATKSPSSGIYSTGLSLPDEDCPSEAKTFWQHLSKQMVSAEGDS